MNGEFFITAHTNAKYRKNADNLGSFLAVEIQGDQRITGTRGATFEKS